MLLSHPSEAGDMLLAAGSAQLTALRPVMRVLTGCMSKQASEFKSSDCRIPVEKSCIITLPHKVFRRLDNETKIIGVIIKGNMSKELLF